MTVRLRLALATGLIVLLMLGVFELSLYAELVANDEDPLALTLVSRHAPRVVALGAVAAGLAAVLAAWVAGAQVLQPLIAIVEEAARLARGGDFHRRLPTNSRDPDVRQVTETFNDLVARVDRVLSAQRQLLEDTSHELRTPLTTLRGNLELLERDLPPRERAEILAESREEVDRMARLVRDLLLLAESNASAASAPIERVPLRLDVIAREVVARLSGSDIERVRIEDEPVSVVGDEERLRQLVGNLVQNALRHASAAPGAVRVRVCRRAPNARLEVEDDGPGVPPEALEKIFDRFYRLDRGRSRSHGGSGLGLSIVRHVAEAHGGRAWASNRTDRSGAVFTVELPAEP
ncbi:MAG: HAMP domain-containing histidine kinase [Chloroflexota bacterium]|nr:HAMP domain-containing histidine kinase [Chloroflexota bacterium]